MCRKRSKHLLLLDALLVHTAPWPSCCPATRYCIVSRGSGSPKAGLETAGISGRKRSLEGFETTRRATIGNQHPRASQTRASSAAARPGGVVTPCNPPSGLAFVSHGSHRGRLRVPTCQYHDRRLDARLSPYKRCGAGLASGLPCHGGLHKYIPSLPAFIGCRVGTGRLFAVSAASMRSRWHIDR